MRPLQNQLMQNTFQHQGKDDEGAGTNQNGRYPGVMLTHQPDGQADGNGKAQQGIDSHQDEGTRRNHIYLRLITLPSLSLKSPQSMIIQSTMAHIPKPPKVRIMAIADPVLPT